MSSRDRSNDLPSIKDYELLLYLLVKRFGGSQVFTDLELQMASQVSLNGRVVFKEAPDGGLLVIAEGD